VVVVVVAVAVAVAAVVVVVAAAAAVEYSLIQKDHHPFPSLESQSLQIRTYSSMAAAE